MGHSAHLRQDNIKGRVVVVVGRAASMLPGHHCIFFFRERGLGWLEQREKQEQIGKKKKNSKKDQANRVDQGLRTLTCDPRHAECDMYRRKRCKL